MNQDSQGNLINLENADGIKLQPSEKLVIIVMNTDDLLIMYQCNFARASNRGYGV